MFFPSLRHVFNNFHSDVSVVAYTDIVIMGSQSELKTCTILINTIPLAWLACRRVDRGYRFVMSTQLCKLK